MPRCVHAFAHAVLCLALGCAAVLPAWAENEKPASLFRSPDDGWLDISGFLDQVYGFVPVAIPITEPAVGYGAAAALALIDKPSDNPAAGFGRPNITVVGGLGTENGTRGAFAGAGAAWNDFGRMDNKQTVTAGGLGFRYEIARKYGLHMGLDVARGPEDTAVYVQVGSAWMRP